MNLGVVVPISLCSLCCMYCHVRHFRAPFPSLLPTNNCEVRKFVILLLMVVAVLLPAGSNHVGVAHVLQKVLLQAVWTPPATEHPHSLTTKQAVLQKLAEPPPFFLSRVEAFATSRSYCRPTSMSETEVCHMLIAVLFATIKSPLQCDGAGKDG